MKENTLIDLDFAPKQDLVYSGKLLKVNRQICVLVNYDDRKKKFDGVTIFRTRNIARYRLWSGDERKSIKLNNVSEYVALLDLKKMSTLYSALKNIDPGRLIAFFTENRSDEYIVGRVIALDRTVVTVGTVDKHGKRYATRKLPINKIDYISFLSEYETRLERKSRI
jgi:hypothetical protein